MKKILVRVAAALFIIGGLVAVLWPVDAWRMYDANWKPLAMTEAEGYCAGILLGESGFSNKEDREGMEACILKNEKKDNTTPRIGSVVKQFCDGLFLSIGFPKSDCEAATEVYNLWPLQYGGYTWEWNDTNKRPEVVQSNISQAPRREGRVDDDRNDTGRGNIGP